MGFGVLTAQETPLRKQFGIEANALIGGGISYELPISQNFLVDFSGGYAMPFSKGERAIAISFVDMAPYTRVEVKRYYNRDNRVRKGKEINNNRGNFLGFQNRMTYNTDWDSSVMMINELHWGVQTELARNLLFTFQVGVGHYYTRGGYNDFFPVLGLKVKYILF